MSNFLPYERVNRCGNDGPGASNMLWWLLNESEWSGPGYNLGVFNCRLPSLHSRGRAWDLGLPLVRGRASPFGDAIIARLVPVAGELGLTELIWNHKRYHRGAQWGEGYDGPSPHVDHIHGGHSLNACRLLTVPHIRAVMAGAPLPSRPSVQPGTPIPPPTPEEDDMGQWFRIDDGGQTSYHGMVFHVYGREFVHLNGEEWAADQQLQGAVAKPVTSQEFLSYVAARRLTDGRK